MNLKNERRAPPIHQIRLSNQWDFEPLGDAESLPCEHSGRHRLKTVSDYTTVDYQGHFRLVRRFGRPSGLSPNNRLELVIEPVQPAIDVSLNGHLLRTSPRGTGSNPSLAPNLFRREVSAILQERNQLSIELHLPAGTGSAGIIRDVWLEIFA